MTSRIYRSKVSHARNESAIHRFCYSIVTFGLELSELENLNRYWPLFGVDRRAVFSIRSKDYLRSESGALKDRLQSVFAKNNFPDFDSVLVISMPRFFGYAFNPVTFYLCCVKERLSRVLAEVHNTFGETYVYALSEPRGAGEFNFEKHFYVSPFFNVDGNYKLFVREFGEHLDISVDLIRSDRVVFSGALNGAGKEFSTAVLIATLFKYPLAGLSTMARIQFEALRLFFWRRISPTLKPENAPYRLTSSAPSRFDRLRLWFVNLARRNRRAATGRKYE